MLAKILRTLITVLFAAMGYWAWVIAQMIIRYLSFTMPAATRIIIMCILIALFAIIGLLLSKRISMSLIKGIAKIVKRAKDLPFKDMVLTCIGLTAGLFIAFLLSMIFSTLSNKPLVITLNIIIYICCGIIGVRVARIRRDDFSFPSRKKEHDDETFSGFTLDASAIIDARVYDIFKTGFLQGKIYIPKFVLDEVSRIADSQDETKRQRGQLGLETVKALQTSKNVKISSSDYEKSGSIDDKIIAFAKEKKTCIMTVDYNLNMLASVQGVKIFNINELANALKPSVVAGDEISVKINKEGKDPSQGVGYLDDGTMVVVEEGSSYLGQTVHATVTSMIQTGTGKIFFVKIKK